MVANYLYLLLDIGIMAVSLPQGLPLACGLLRCILLMSITLTYSIAFRVAMPTLTSATTALSPFRCVVYLKIVSKMKI